MAFQLAKLYTQEKVIKLGYDIYTNEERAILDRHLGDVWLIAAMTGYGKTLLVRNLIAQLGDRKLIGFDSRKEHKNLARANIMNSEGKGKGITDLIYIDEFGFKLQDFQNPTDWEYIMPSLASARICSDAASKVYRHKNDFDKFFGIINKIPTKGKDSEMYMVLEGIKSRLKNIRRNFIDEHSVDITDKSVDEIRYTNTPFYVSDWKYFIKKHHHICINFNSENNPDKSQLFAGKILHDIRSILKQNTPSVIFMEESHYLYPAVLGKDNISYSSDMIYHYTKTKHKDAVKLVLITQYPHQLSDNALDEVKWFFIGKLENIKGYSKLDEVFKTSSKLQYNPLTNYREWFCYSPVYNEKFIFSGFDSFTHYEERK